LLFLALAMDEEGEEKEKEGDEGIHEMEVM